MTTPPTIVVWNASAGRIPLATNKLDAAGIVEMLARHGVTADVRTSSSADDAFALASNAAKDGARMVVAAGGDGTIGICGRALLDTETSLAILPLGSVMNIPRMLGLPRDVEAAAEIIGTGVSRQVDVGEANGTVFFEAANVGISAAIFGEAERFQQGNYGSLLRAVRNAFRYRPARMRIELDDGATIETRALMVSVANGPYTGLAMTVAPDARLDDGKFDVLVFRHFSKIELFRHLGSITFGRRGYSPHVTTKRSSSVRIESSRPLPARADSQELGYTPLVCRVRPAALRVVVAGE